MTEDNHMVRIVGVLLAVNMLVLFANIGVFTGGFILGRATCPQTNQNK